MIAAATIKNECGRSSLKIKSPTNTPKKELIADTGTAIATAVDFRDLV